MKSFCILGVVLLLSVVELEAATSAYESSCPKRNLTVTVDDTLRLYFDGIEITGLPNASFCCTPDVVELPCTTRLIAIHGRNRDASDQAGILASTADEYVLTNSTWKCSNVNHSGWEEIDFDDSDWVPAVELGRNGGSFQVLIPGISLNASWIWLWKLNDEELELEVYCRKKLALSFCTSSPCAFGGTCIEDPNGEYQCICASGYSGQNCSVVIDYCESSPCANGGSCLPIVNGYVCQCPPGYTDDNCDDMVNNCASLPCLNGGTCLNGINYFVCECPPQWTGVICDTLLNSCGSQLCPNGGTCLNYCGQPQCVCAPEWTGTLCLTHIEPCTSNPCQNGGSCQDTQDGWTCTCQTYFTGFYCEQIIDLCASSPCQNGGTCVFDCGVYQCFCPEGSTGQNCQSLVLQPVVELAATSVSQSSCQVRNLTVTVDDYMKLYFDGIEITGLPNADIYNKADVVELPCTTSLIAIHGRENTEITGLAGILASTDDEYVLTNSSWKCSNISQSGWEETDFDDSDWMSGVDYGHNGNSTLVFIPGISTSASWIWLRQLYGQVMDINVYCRKRLAINYCESSPCANGASCEPIENGYVCQCPPGYTGDRCQYVTNNCESFPCLNGGTCYTGIDDYLCVCSPEWTGDRCDILLNPCDGLLCPNGGTCLNYCGEPQCVCASEWTGTLCLTHIDPCASNPCQNGGSCQDAEDGLICTCPQYFTGLYCEQIIDLCASSPCLHGSTCVFDCGVYRCFCRDGWTGESCEIIISACDPNPCLNGGTCNDLGNDSYTCTCPVSWTGVKCESSNYDESIACGTTLTWSQYNASNGFTRLCYFWAPSEDIDGRNTECRYTINGIPLYDNYVGLLNAGGNFGCFVSHYYPEDLPSTSELSCEDNYQQDVSLANYTENARLMVCIRYPYEGEPGRK